MINITEKIREDQLVRIFHHNGARMVKKLIPLRGI
jgi:hypothetical protein